LWPFNGIKLLYRKEKGTSELKSESTIGSVPAIVYSESADGRNYFRSQLNECGFNAVCFGNEAICYDNLRPIQPKIVLAETNSEAVVWRFIFALHAMRVFVPLIVVSARLRTAHFNTTDLKLPLRVIVPDETKTLAMYKSIKVANKSSFGNSLFVGQAEAITTINKMLPMLSKTHDAVLVTGEPGTGKELLIRLIASLADGLRSFIKIDCREIEPDMLINGFLRNTFDNLGHSGSATIFLDHLDELPSACQAEMLMVMDAQQKSGNGETAGCNRGARFLSASSRSVRSLLQEGNFRKDLFYRLNVIPVMLPALRERKEDISLLMDYFVLDSCARMKKCITIPSKKAREVCYLYDWPGNIAELKNQMDRVAKTGNEKCLYANTRLPTLDKKAPFYLDTVAETEDLLRSYAIKENLSDLNNISLKGICNEYVSLTEKRLLKKALAKTNWNRKKAAKLLNMSYKSVLNKIKTYDII
jgi:two-component system response regulator AtoC